VVFSGHPVQTIRSIARETGLVPNTIAKALEALGRLGMVKETTGKKRNRIYVYEKYMEVLTRGM
jgi:DNA-binding transcriptional regulator YhcF (GntR family)